MQAIISGLVLSISLWRQRRKRQLQRFESSQIAMGTTIVIVLYAPDAATANRAFQAAFDRITLSTRR